jgi:hypothetical protein
MCPERADVRPLHPAAVRWASLLLRIRGAREDVRTVGEWARLVNMSEASLRACCVLARVKPRRSLALARLIRAITLAPSMRCAPSDLIDVRDPRTLRRMFLDAGLADPSSPSELRPDVDALLCRQRLVRAEAALDALREALASPGGSTGTNCGTSRTKA